jgi:hypothetical protein
MRNIESLLYVHQENVRAKHATILRRNQEVQAFRKASWERTRNRVPDENDIREVKLLAAQGFDSAAISCGLELTTERVAQALAV